MVAGARSPSPDLRELESNGSVEALPVDLSTSKGPVDLVAAAIARGGPGVVVNNVGAAHSRLIGFLEVSDEDWIATMNLNLLSAVRTVRAALPAMQAAGRGSIVTTSSVNSFLPDPSIIDYCASKAALSNFSKALSKELGPLGIRVNMVSPGPVTTDLWLVDGGVASRVARATGGDAASVAKNVAQQAVTGRFSRPDEVADLVVFLASERAANITGSDFVIDGGLVTTL